LPLSLSPEERSVRARLGALSLHATHNPKETTKAARAAFNAKFEEEVDPQGILEPAERARRASYARKAYYTRMALASAKARRKRAEASP
jgi:hypothetical protein